MLIAATLWINAIILPLTQNDALEYAIVGRELYHLRDLAIYPLLNSKTNLSGFYGPWTHPPLYVSLIYVSHLLQGSADNPALMRLIAPWCALLCTGVVFALGNMISRRSGLIAALFFLTTPLLFLGADSGLIDALPVLGAAWMVAALIGFTGKPWRMGAAQGVMIGMALWTHSSAILLVPLACAGITLLHGIKQWRSILPQMATMFIFVGFISAWPYLRNLEIFGSLISDNPEVFALASLDWKDYFAYNRGISTLTSKIQYGLFKGLFAIEAYGIIFWLMTLGIIYYFRRILPLKYTMRCWLDVRQVPQPVIVYVCIFLVLAYLVGVIVSMALDIDLMIRNERYMLMILPMVAIISAWFFDAMLAQWWRYKRRGSRYGVVLILGTGVIITSQLTLFLLYRLLAVSDYAHDFSKKNETIALNQSEYASVDYLKKHTPKDSMVLAMRPADMYYARRRMVSYLDPSVIPFYKEKKPEKALQILENLGITHVQMTDYMLPPVYRTALMEILANPAYTSLIYSYDGRQIYALKPYRSERLNTVSMDIREIPWISQTQWLVGGRQALLRIPITHKVSQDFPSLSESPWGLFQRDFSKRLISESVPIPFHKTQGALNASFSGYGAIDIRMAYENSESSVLLGKITLTDEGNQSFMRRFEIPSDARKLRIIIEHYGNSYLSAEGMALAFY